MIKRALVDALQARYEAQILVTIKELINFYREETQQNPLLIFLSLINIKNYKIQLPSNLDIETNLHTKHTIDRDHLILPEVMIEDYNVDLYTVMKPIFDTVWNAAGYPRALNYDEQGNWLGNK